MLSMPDAFPALVAERAVSILALVKDWQRLDEGALHAQDSFRAVFTSLFICQLTVMFEFLSRRLAMLLAVTWSVCIRDGTALPKHHRRAHASQLEWVKSLASTLSVQCCRLIESSDSSRAETKLGSPVASYPLRSVLLSGLQHGIKKLLKYWGIFFFVALIISSEKQLKFPGFSSCYWWIFRRQ